MSILIDLTGRSFGRLVVLGRAPGAYRRVHWSCRCDCGGFTIVQGSNLTKQQTPTLSCGCLQRERTASAHLTHGCAARGQTLEYRTWKRMKTRCFNPRSTQFEYWGGRGVTVCERWKNSFEAFQADMGLCPSSLHSLDRYPNHDGHYEPGNCRWATARQQALNRREYHPGARLTTDLVNIIRRLAEAGMSRRTISRRFGVSKGAVQHVIDRRTWARVDEHHSTGVNGR